MKSSATKSKKTIEENLSTIRRELGENKHQQWDEPTLNEMMIEEFEKLLGPLKPNYKNDELITKMKELKTSMTSDAWLFQKGKRIEGRVVKVRSGLEVIQRLHKATGGLIRAEFTVEDGKYKGISISGDFFCFPRDAVDRLAAELEECPVDHIYKVIAAFYQTKEIAIPGVTPKDWIQAFRI